MSKTKQAIIIWRKGKTVPAISFGRIGSFFYRFISGNTLSENILFSLAAILAGYHIIGKLYNVSGYETIESFQYSFVNDQLQLRWNVALMEVLRIALPGFLGGGAFPWRLCSQKPTWNGEKLLNLTIRSQSITTINSNCVSWTIGLVTACKSSIVQIPTDGVVGLVEVPLRWIIYCWGKY